MLKESSKNINWIAESSYVVSGNAGYTERKAYSGRKRACRIDRDCREGICGQCGMMINGIAHGPLKIQRPVSCISIF